MPLSDFDGLLTDLDDAFAEPIVWLGQRFRGRFTIDPYAVPLAGTDQGISQIVTWCYIDQREVPGPGFPQLGDVLTIRGRPWEIVEAGVDDLGELQYRLIKFEDELPTAPMGDDDRRGPGRPSRRDEIESAFDQLQAEGKVDPSKPLNRIFNLVRHRITGSAAPSPGLGDKTLHNILAGKI